MDEGWGKGECLLTSINPILRSLNSYTYLLRLHIAFFLWCILFTWKNLNLLDLYDPYWNIFLSVVLDLIKPKQIWSELIGPEAYFWRWTELIEYKSIPGASTINLSFWLSWSFDMVSRASVTKRLGVRISSTPPFSVEYLAPTSMRETCATLFLGSQLAA